MCASIHTSHTQNKRKKVNTSICNGCCQTFNKPHARKIHAKTRKTTDLQRMLPCAQRTLQRSCLLGSLSLYWAHQCPCCHTHHHQKQHHHRHHHHRLAQTTHFLRESLNTHWHARMHTFMHVYIYACLHMYACMFHAHPSYLGPRRRLLWSRSRIGRLPAPIAQHG